MYIQTTKYIYTVIYRIFDGFVLSDQFLWNLIHYRCDVIFGVGISAFLISIPNSIYSCAQFSFSIPATISSSSAGRHGISNICIQIDPTYSTSTITTSAITSTISHNQPNNHPHKNSNNHNQQQLKKPLIQSHWFHPILKPPPNNHPPTTTTTKN